MRLFLASMLALAMLTGCAPTESTDSTGAARPNTVLSTTTLTSTTSTTVTSTTSAVPSKTVPSVAPVKQEFEYTQPNGAYAKVVCSHDSDIKLKYVLTASNLGLGTYIVEYARTTSKGDVEPNGSIPRVVMENVGIDEIVTITIETERFTATPIRMRGCTKV